MKRNDFQFAALAKSVIWHRKPAKLSQQTLSLLAGVSRTAVQRLEGGEKNVQLEILFKILNTLNIILSLDSRLLENSIPLKEDNNEAG